MSLDLWRCKFARPNVVTAIAENCHELEELDIGWWYVGAWGSYASSAVCGGGGVSAMQYPMMPPKLNSYHIMLIL